MIYATCAPRQDEADTAFGDVLAPGHSGAARVPEPNRPRGTACRTRRTTGSREVGPFASRRVSFHGKIAGSRPSNGPTTE